VIAVDLDVLERRVVEKWVAAAARMPRWELPEFDMSAWELPEFDMSAWDEAMKTPLPPGTPQFPREQWASYPNRRRVALMICDRLLDFDELTDEQWVTLCMVMQYGGKTRIA
jgi:hypothetical protein